MPIYEYHCSRCGTFEITQKITEAPLGKCPTCKGKVKKLISTTTFQLKGSGWYLTDYARKDRKGQAAADGNGAKSSSSDSKESKSDSKSDSKSEASSSKSEKSSSTSGAASGSTPK